MKTKDLIKMLQEIDPEGKTECCIHNCDIHFADKMPAYWDGTLEILERDHSKDPYYNICGAKYTSRGSKIKLIPLSISDAIRNDINLKIDYSEIGNPDKAKAYEEADNQTRKAQNDIEIDCEYHLFLEWAKTEADKISNNRDTFNSDVRDFFDKNIKHTDPLPAHTATLFKEDSHGTKWGLSYRYRRFIQWSESIKLEFEGFDWKLTKI